MSSKTNNKTKEAADSQAGKVPKELREKLKKAKAAKGLLQALEEEIRNFIKNWEEKNHDTKPATEEDVMSLDSDDEEIVFVGRNGQMHEIPSPPNPDIVKDDKLVFDSAADDHGANFGYVNILPFSLFLPDTHTQLRTNSSLHIGVGSSIPSDHTTVFEPGPSPSATRRDERPMLGSNPEGDLFRPCRAALATCLVPCGVWSKIERRQYAFPQPHPLDLVVPRGANKWRHRTTCFLLYHFLLDAYYFVSIQLSF